MLRVLLFWLLFALLDSVLSREIIQISAFTRVVSLEQISLGFLSLPLPLPILREILSLLLVFLSFFYDVKELLLCKLTHSSCDVARQ